MSEIQNEILELLKKISDKIDKIAGTKASSPSPAAKAPAPTPAKSAVGTATIESTPLVKPSAIAQKQADVEKAEKEAEEEIPEKPEGRRVCPKCGATEFNAIDDKTRPLHYISGAPIFAKKYICKKCGEEVP